MKNTILISAVVLIGSLLTATEASAQEAFGGGYTEPGTTSEENTSPEKFYGGIDIGYGSGFNFGQTLLGYSFIPHFGLDIGYQFIKLNTDGYDEEMYWMAQALLGLHFDWSLREQSHFGPIAHFRMGYGGALLENDPGTSGLVIDAAVGFQFTRHFFVAVAYNRQGGYTSSYGDPSSLSGWMLRIGVKY
jgi:hypothetical protein